MNMQRLSLFTFIILISFAHSALAERREVFKGIAKEGGKTIYIETHEVTYSGEGKVLEAKTTYVDPEGKLLGTLSSDFRNSLNLPEHVFLDERNKNQYGIRRNDGKIVLFNQDPGKAETVLELDSDTDKQRILIGCQGFNYFLKDKIEDLKQKKIQPVLFMVPGDLSTYKFVLELVSENPDQTVNFRVKIENWFLRAFAPELEFKYDKKIDRIVWYKGISNIKNSAGKNIDVVIDYQ